MISSLRGAAFALLVSTSAIVPGLSTASAQVSLQAGMSEAFRAQAEQIKAAPTVASAQSLIDTASGPLEKYVAAALMMQAASASNDLKAERKALSALFDTKGLPAADVPRLHSKAGVLSLMINDPKDAIAQIRYAESLGYRDQQGQIALADALLRTKDTAASMAALDAARTLQGQGIAPLSESWYDRALAMAVSTKQPQQIAVWGSRKVAAYPSDRNWRSALMAYMTRPGIGPDELLDLYRLGAARNALVAERDWTGYSAVANTAGAFAEAKAALETGRSRGAIADDPQVKKDIALLTPKSAKQLSGIAARATAAGKAAKGDAALAVADEYLSSAQFPKAVEYYQMALAKGVTDKDRATVRLGIAQIRNGDNMGGQTTLAQVTTGPWASVSSFWSVPVTPGVTASAQP